MFLHFFVEQGPVDAEQPGRLGLIIPGGCQGLLDRLFFGAGLGLLDDETACGGNQFNLALQVEGQVGQMDFIPFEVRQGALQDVREFANISRPIIIN